MYKYLTMQILSYPAVKIVNSDEYVVAEAASGHIVFPSYLAVIQILENVRKQEYFDSVGLSRAGMNLNIRAPQNIEQVEQVLELLYKYHKDSVKE